MKTPVPGAGLDLQDPDVVCGLFDRAAALTENDPRRRGNVIELPRYDRPGVGRFTLTGDLHDNFDNLVRITRVAQLEASPDHFLVLHELSHGDRLVNGVDMSAITVARVAALKVAFPEQVFLLMSNHDLAQLRGEGISKGGVSVVEAFDDGVEYLYGDEAPRVLESMNRFFRSMALGVRCGNGVFISHSLPAPKFIDDFDPAVLDRAYEEADLEPPRGSAYVMVWGRHHNDKIASELKVLLDAKVFVVGHQPAEMGWEVQGQHILIINSDHHHGVALPIDLHETYTQDTLIDHVVPLNSIRLH